MSKLDSLLLVGIWTFSHLSLLFCGYFGNQGRCPRVAIASVNQGPETLPFFFPRDPCLRGTTALRALKLSLLIRKVSLPTCLSHFLCPCHISARHGSHFRSYLQPQEIWVARALTYLCRVPFLILPPGVQLRSVSMRVCREGQPFSLWL